MVVARNSWLKQMARAGIRRDGHRKLPLTPGVPRVAAEDECVLGLVIAARAGSGFQSGGAREIREALDLLRRKMETTQAMYIYYAPDPGERLGPAAARRMIQALGGDRS
jgi:hypothetical protein